MCYSFELHADHHNIKRNIVKDYIDDEAESSELEYSSDDDDEDNLPTFIDESDDDLKGIIDSYLIYIKKKFVIIYIFYPVI